MAIIATHGFVKRLRVDARKGRWNTYYVRHVYPACVAFQVRWTNDGSAVVCWLREIKFCGEWNDAGTVGRVAKIDYAEFQTHIADARERAKLINRGNGFSVR